MKKPSFPLGPAFKAWRTAMGWTQDRTAKELGLTMLKYAAIENGDVYPSIHVLDSARDLHGIDIYLLAYCHYTKPEKFPDNVRGAIENLAKELRSYMSLITVVKHKLPRFLW